MIRFAIPVAIYEIECELATGRPFGYTERTVLRSIASSHTDFASILSDLALHPRILSECLAMLFEAGIIEFSANAGAFDITPLGQEALADHSFVPSTIERRTRWRKVIVERVSGLPALNLRYRRINELEAQGIRVLQASSVDPMPARFVTRQLLEREFAKSKQWVRSAGPARLIDGFRNAVVVSVDRAHVDGLPSVEWKRVFAGELGPEAEAAAPPWIEPDTRWIAVPRSRISPVFGARDHAATLESMLETARSYVFVHSAFLTGVRAHALFEPIAAALKRGVDVIVGRGAAGELTNDDDDAKQVFGKIGYDYGRALGRFYFAPFPTGSHAKLAIRDGREVVIGSFNWLSGRPDSQRPELSLRVDDRRVAATACDLAADLFRERASPWPLQVLRSRTEPADTPSHVEAEGHVDIRLLIDAQNRERMFRYLDEARERLSIWSDKVTPKADGILHGKLLKAAERLNDRKKLTLHYSAADGDRAEILDGLEERGALLLPDGTNHMKAMVCDDRYALVTSFNLLSFGGLGLGRAAVFELGLEVKTSDGAALRAILPQELF